MYRPTEGGAFDAFAGASPVDELPAAGACPVPLGAGFAWFAGVFPVDALPASGACPASVDRLILDIIAAHPVCFAFPAFGLFWLSLMMEATISYDDV